MVGEDELNKNVEWEAHTFIQTDFEVSFVFFDNLGCNEMFEIFILDVS